MHIEIEGSGPPLLLLHGFTGSTRNWESVVPPLTKNHTVITVDLPGHGQTPSPTDLSAYQMESVAPALNGLMEEMGHSSFNLLGYSMGGRLTLYMAIQYPAHVSKLILESASPGLKTAEERDARRASDNALADRIESEGVESFVDFWESISLWESQKDLTQKAAANLRQIRLENNPSGLANSLRGMGTGRQPSLWGSLKHLKSPTLLLTGELDGKFCKIGAEMHRLMPNSQHKIIPLAGHTIHLEQPDQWLAEVQQFLAD